MFPLRDSIPSSRTPIVTIGLIVVNLLVFFYELSLGPIALAQFTLRYGTVPAALDWTSLLTSMFLHGGWMHVLGNMWFLWVFGDNIEDTLGHFNYLLFYLLCGFAGGLAHVALSPGSATPAIGASGAISGVMGAYLLKFPRSQVKTLIFIFVLVTTFDVPAPLMIGYWIFIQVLSGFGSLAAHAGSAGGGTAWFAHIGGFLAGMILVFAFPSQPPARSIRW